ncbi:9674_t:CDS:2 [Acaulospora colombiana]|uniref:9674_t:CDS:1 n=1 Tax=Acaulospora colombiana TaxID=27376 RepID=A0ACA9M988_9GLOM|nr:9674_t:CDS:2 [Acaulospora colombiana]
METNLVNTQSNNNQTAPDFRNVDFGTISQNPGIQNEVDAKEKTEDCWCFIGGIAKNTEYRDLKYFLETYFGKIKHVDIVKSKACAFVEFYEESSYQLAINVRTVKYGNKLLRIEKRMNKNNKGKERQS